MKKCALQVISLCLALFMALVSDGVNIYHYCCNACEEHGRDIFHIMSCKEVHSTTHHDECNMHHDMIVYDCCMHGDGDNCSMQTEGHCDVQHVEAPYLSHFNTEKVSFVAPLVATLTSIHNSQFVIDNYEQETLNYGIPIALNLPGRAIIVRKAAYLI